MKIFILNHTTHNKGDNSVLYNLISGLKQVVEPSHISISTSDGSAPFWIQNSQTFTFIPWLGGKMFRSPKLSLLSNSIRVIRRKVNYKILFPILLSFGAKGYNKPIQYILKILYRQFYNCLIDADIVICTGGHHISTVLEKNSINSQTTSIVVSAIIKQNMILWSQSIGPLPSKKYVLKSLQKSLKNCSIFVRDDKSIECLQKLNLNNYKVAPDSVFLSASSEITERNNKIIIAIYTAGITNEKYLTDYKNSWIQLIELINRMGKHEINFLPMQYQGYGGDERSFIKEIIAECSIQPVLLDKDLSPSESLSLIRESALVIGHKTHSVIYALATQTPIIALAYHPKTTFFMKSFGFDEFCFDDIIGNEEKIMDLIAHRIEEENIAYKANSLSLKNKEQLLNYLKESLNKDEN